jgi:tetrahydromethanopterin S-methyltransferase subunit B
MYDGDPMEPQPKPLLADLPVQSEAEQAAGLVKTYVHGVAIGIDRIFWNLVVERTDWAQTRVSPFRLPA